jgi:uncharacterized protein YecT (DUF1311 family)
MGTHRTALLLAIGMLSAHAAAQTDRPASLPEWQPNPDQAIQQLEQVLAQLDQQQPRNYTISNLSSLYDSKLFVVFNGFVAGLPEFERTQEIEGQRLWLAKRKARIDAAYAEYEGGTLASYKAGEAFIDITRKRIAEIVEKRKQVLKRP